MAKPVAESDAAEKACLQAADPFMTWHNMWKMQHVWPNVMNDRNLGAALTIDAVEKPLAVIMDDIERDPWQNLMLDRRLACML